LNKEDIENNHLSKNSPHALLIISLGRSVGGRKEAERKGEKKEKQGEKEERKEKMEKKEEKENKKIEKNEL
jgi:hypothetical protein